jgi:hypothetical protein
MIRLWSFETFKLGTGGLKKSNRLTTKQEKRVKLAITVRVQTGIRAVTLEECQRTAHNITVYAVTLLFS